MRGTATGIFTTLTDQKIICILSRGESGICDSLPSTVPKILYSSQDDRLSEEMIKKPRISHVCIYLSAWTTHQKVPDVKNTLNLSGKPVRMSKHSNRIARSWKLAKTTFYPFWSLLKFPGMHQTGQPRWHPHLCQALSMMPHTEQVRKKTQMGRLGGSVG